MFQFQIFQMYFLNISKRTCKLFDLPVFGIHSFNPFEPLSETWNWTGVDKNIELRIEILCLSMPPGAAGIH